MKVENKYCKDCVSFIDIKPLPACKSSKYNDLVSGYDKRLCLIERLDGIGRCGGAGNNYTAAKVPAKKKPGPKPKDA